MGRGGKWAITEFVVERPLTARFPIRTFHRGNIPDGRVALGG